MTHERRCDQFQGCRPAIRWTRTPRRVNQEITVIDWLCNLTCDADFRSWDYCPSPRAEAVHKDPVNHPILCFTLLHYPPDPMSHTPVPTASSSSNFRSIFDDALNDFKKKTKKDLLAHQLTAQLQNCDSPSAILDVLNSQYDFQQFIQSQRGTGSSKQWLSSTVTVLCAFSAALGEGTSMASLQRLSSGMCPLTFRSQVFSPAKVVFAGVGVFLMVRNCLDWRRQL
jgi:hypothetical protein